jgi:hypothetical protein
MTQPNAALAAERIMRRLGLEPDPWQLEVLRGQHARLLLNCCRQAGKSTIVALHALLQALYTDDLLVLLLSRSHRQSAELFQTVTRFFQRIGSPLKALCAPRGTHAHRSAVRLGRCHRRSAPTAGTHRGAVSVRSRGSVGTRTFNPSFPRSAREREPSKLASTARRIP